MKTIKLPDMDAWLNACLLCYFALLLCMEGKTSLDSEAVVPNDVLLHLESALLLHL